MSIQTVPPDFWVTDQSTFSGIANRRDRAVLTVIIVGGALAVSGTSAAAPTKVWDDPYVLGADATVCGPVWDPEVNRAGQRTEATRQAISELRQISGLTWDQVGQLFGVSRRSVHHWASGKPLNSGNEARLMRVLDVVRHADRGSARETRAALLNTSDGTTPFDMLVAQRFDEVRAALGRGRRRPGQALSSLSPEAKAARRPLPPDMLVEGMSERVGKDPGQARAAQTVRNKRRGSS